MNRNFITWIILIVLTVVSFTSSETIIGSISTISLMGIATIKCTLVGFRFMELGKAHILWRVALLSLIGLFSVIVILVSV